MTARDRKIVAAIVGGYIVALCAYGPIVDLLHWL